MNAPVHHGDLLTAEEVVGTFFAPAATDLVTGMVAEYRQQRARIEAVAAWVKSPDVSSVMHHFLEGNADENRGRITMAATADQLFRVEGAIAHLNATFWSKALALTDVYDSMPQDRRNQWNAQIRNPEGTKKDRHQVDRERGKHPERFDEDGKYLNPDDAWELPPLPDFEEETVRATLLGLLASRAKFLAERVDGIFRALSGEHVTNSPAAFGKRMIIAHLVSSYDTVNHDRVGYINDLRCVIAKFMGRDEPRWDATTKVVDRARRERRGEWVTLDGGALRLRAYKCGTAHLEVHPDMAWRLNCVLAHLHPLAIPPEFRANPKRKPKDFVMMGRPLPFAVIAHLESLETAYNMVENTGNDAWRNKYRRVEIPNGVQPRGGWSGAAAEEAERVLAYVGGVKTKNERGGAYFAFDYNPREVIADIICTGCLPDQKAHQYYPTPAAVAEASIELAQIGPHDMCLEPSAGTGGLADFMPKDRTVCIEISALHCKVLEAKGYDVTKADFLHWNASGALRFSRIVMNPPFSDGRWQAHLERASTMLAKGGRLVAILPASAKGKDVLPGWSCEWSKVFANEFAGTSVDVAILVAERA